LWADWILECLEVGHKEKKVHALEKNKRYLTISFFFISSHEICGKNSGILHYTDFHAHFVVY